MHGIAIDSNQTFMGFGSGEIDQVLHKTLRHVEKAIEVNRRSRRFESDSPQRDGLSRLGLCSGNEIDRKPTQGSRHDDDEATVHLSPFAFNQLHRIP